MIELPQIPELPEHPAGWEISPQDAQALIEQVSRREWNIGWSEFRRRWNYSMETVPDGFDLPPDAFTPEEYEQLRPLARLLCFAVVGMGPGMAGQKPPGGES